MVGIGCGGVGGVVIAVVVGGCVGEVCGAVVCGVDVAGVGCGVVVGVGAICVGVAVGAVGALVYVWQLVLMVVSWWCVWGWWLWCRGNPHRCRLWRCCNRW